MARCGCSDSCSCLVTGGPGLAVSGTGSARDPYTLRVTVSADAGNALGFGSDNGLYTSGSGGGGGGGVTVDGLPTSGVIGGYQGAGYLISPPYARRSYRRAVDLGLNIAHADCWATADGAVAIGFSSVGSLVAGPGQDSTVAAHTAASWSKLRWQLGEGDQADPDPYHGYFGFTEPPQYGGTLLTEVLAEVGNRIVLALVLQTPTAGQPSPAASQTLRDIQLYGCQKSVIAVSMLLDDLTTFTQAGIATGGLVYTGNADTLTPQALTGAGARWAYLLAYGDGSLTQDQITPYVDAGLSVILLPCDHHYQHDYVQQVGARGALCGDPVYYSGDVTRYKTADNSSHFESYGVHYGWLSQQTDTGGLTNGADHIGKDARGFYYPYSNATARNCWYLPSSGLQKHGVVQGYLCPIPADAYTIHVTFQFGSVANTGNWLGIVFACVDDHPYMDGGNDPFDGQPHDSGYLVYIHQNGQTGIVRRDGANGVNIGTTGSIGTPVANTFYTVAISVSGATITAGLDGGGGTAATASDSTYRGQYVQLAKTDTVTPADHFDAGFRRVWVTTP